MDLRGTERGASTAAARIAITGVGAVTPLGVGVEGFWSALIDGRCGIERIASIPAETLEELPVRIAGEVPDFDPTPIMGRKLVRQTDAFSQYAFVAANEAIGKRVFPDPERVAIVMATAMGGVVPLAEGQADFDRQAVAPHRHKMSPRFVPRTLGNIAAAHIAIARGFTGPLLTVSTACASGNDAVIVGANLLRSGACDVVICVGADCVITPVVIDSLASAGALSRRNDDPAGACRPFDRARDGFVIGAGGGAVVLERAEDAEDQGAIVYGHVAGWAQNNDAYSIISPDPAGVHVKRCMEGALAAAGIGPSAIGYINAHGTATEAGDATEADAIAEVFEGCAPWVSSTKGATGHMMAGGGIVELIACLLALRTGALPPSLNLEDPAFDLRFVGLGDRDESIAYALSNAFGFGGQNSSVIVTR